MLIISFSLSFLLTAARLSGSSAEALSGPHSRAHRLAKANTYTTTSGAALALPASSASELGGFQDQPTAQANSIPNTTHPADTGGRKLDGTAACHVDAYTSQPPNVTFPPFNQVEANIYRYRQQQSVNLGSWFVQEQWMCPSLFSCASGKQMSELDVASGWGSTTSARAVLEKHWDTFVTQADFEYLASIGINTVRLPIGYWSLGPEFCIDTPFASVADVYQGVWARVVRAINEAGEAGLGVLVDLHGAVGSQNGQPHSGTSDGKANLCGNQSNMDKTLAVLMYLMQHLVDVTNVVGIQLLNEPNYCEELPAFYDRAISGMRKISPRAETFPLYIHDSFDLVKFSDYVGDRMDFVVEDHHSYFVFTPSDNQESASGHTRDINGPISDSYTQASIHQRRNLVIDEWSCALTPQSLSQETDERKAQKDFCHAQLKMYTACAAGWSFWSYNKEDCNEDPGWCFKAAVGNTLPSSFYSYGQGVMSDPSSLRSLASLVADMKLPSVQDILEKSRNPTYSGATLLSSRASVLPLEDPVARDYGLTFNSHHYEKRDDNDTTATQKSTVKGYSDGFLTAKIFATYRMSKLGFISQYMQDGLMAMAPTSKIANGTESVYKTWFMNGLQDGQAVIFSSLT